MSSHENRSHRPAHFMGMKKRIIRNNELTGIMIITGEEDESSSLKHSVENLQHLIYLPNPLRTIGRTIVQPRLLSNPMRNINVLLEII